jgi:2-hydroxychromene-2-carboxylate isomerase
MDDAAIFRDAFLASGIDIDRLIARARQDDVKQRLIDNTSKAVARGEFGSPTFFVGDEMFFGKDRLRDVEESILEQTSAVAQRRTA